MGKVTECSKLHNEGLHNLFFSPNIIRVIKWRMVSLLILLKPCIILSIECDKPATCTLHYALKFSNYTPTCFEPSFGSSSGRVRISQITHTHIQQYDHKIWLQVFVIHLFYRHFINLTGVLQTAVTKSCDHTVEYVCDFWNCDSPWRRTEWRFETCRSVVRKF
jgi:hypothetical protein